MPKSATSRLPRQQEEAAAKPTPAPPTPAPRDPRKIIITNSLAMPLSLLIVLREAAVRRSERMRREAPPPRRGLRRPSTRPTVSGIVVEILTRHLDEIKAID